jgi:hypothetical protein
VSAVQADCRSVQLEFQGLGKRRVEGGFDGGRVSSDAGVLLLREAEARLGWMARFSRCFVDHRRQERIEHPLETLVGQRVVGLALGYEDLNDHDELRDDALLALAAGQTDLVGARRRREQDRGHALAGKSTLNRLELTPAEATARTRYKKIVYQGAAIERQFVDCYLDAHEAEPPERVVLDLDATDDPLHGHQEGRFFHGYYGGYCYLPLYIFCGAWLLAAKLRPSNGDAAAGATEELERIVGQIRERWPGVEIWIRADSGFARDAIMAWCEAHGVDYVLGLAKNARLRRAIGRTMAEAQAEHAATGAPARRYQELRYRTRKSWSRERRVVAKAEQLPGKANPRFVVTSLPTDRFAARELYEGIYCARGDMENRIKEQQLGLFADRTSTATMRANQLRLWFSAMAYTMLQAIRHYGLRGTELARAQVGTIRLRLLKIGAIVRLSTRRVAVSFSSAYPLQALFAGVLARLQRASPRPN